jgi:hypothetical protein
MADEQPSAPAPQSAPPEAAVVATPQSDPTPAQVESKSVVKSLSDDIDGLWGKLDGLKVENQQPRAERQEPAEPTPEPQQPTRQRDENGRFLPKAETAQSEPAPAEPVAEATPTEAIDPAELRRQAYEQAKAEYEANERAQREAAARVQAEAEFSQRVERYRGSDADRAALQRALEAANLGNPSALDAIDVTLPNGQKVSELRGVAGLTPEEAQNVLNGWKQADELGDALADRKVGQLVGYWNNEVMAELQDPDVDAAAVTRHQTPGAQMRALKESVRAKVTQRLTDAHAVEIKAKDAEIARQAERIASLTEERGNRRSADLAANAATPDRPGAAGSPRRDLPTPDELRSMSADEAFKSGAIDRLFQSIPGGLPARRRAG